MMQVLQKKPYGVFAGHHLNATEWQQLLPVASASRWLLVTDTNTAKYCSPMLRSVLPDHEFMESVIPAGEGSKLIDTVHYLWQQWKEVHVGRDAHVVLLGGGVVGDLGAFAAATYGRGIPVTQVPTSLLAMVDASLGGKTAINLDGVKNMVGTFTYPQQVIIDTRWLDTLPRREYQSGMGEVLKYGLLRGGRLWKMLQQGLSGGADEAIISACVRNKLQIVRQDPHDKGTRQLLNLGHTVGHAVEAWSHTVGQPLWHGEAVAVGLVFATALSAELGLMTAELALSTSHTIRQYFPDIALTVADWSQLQYWLQHDKKKSGDTLKWVLLHQPGEVRHGIAVADVAALEAAFTYTKDIFSAA